MGTHAAHGKVALVTGAANGIGRATALRLAAEGAHVAIVDIAAADEVVATIREAGGTAEAFRADVSSEEQVIAVVAEIEQTMGPVQVLVNNAGLHPDPPTLIKDMSLDFWKRTMAVDLDSMFLFIRAVLPKMSETGWGRIINLSSASVYGITPPGGAHYVAAKAACGALAAGLAIEVAEHGITSNAVAPSTVDTPGLRKLGGQELLDLVTGSQTIKKIMQPSDIAGVISFLASDDAAMITGQVIHADAGSSRVN
jgi:NAD(P)-dependent dehydrogenase (short-subunit alcohol dehydrogenase family)